MTEAERKLRELKAIAVKHGVEPQLLLDWLTLETSANVLFVKMLRGVEEQGQFMQEVAGTSDLPMTETHQATYVERVTLLDELLEKELSGGIDELAERIRETLRPHLPPSPMPATPPPLYAVKGSNLDLERRAKLEGAFNEAMEKLAELIQHPEPDPITQEQRDAKAQQFRELKMEDE